MREAAFGRKASMSACIANLKATPLSVQVDSATYRVRTLSIGENESMSNSTDVPVPYLPLIRVVSITNSTGGRRGSWITRDCRPG